TEEEEGLHATVIGVDDRRDHREGDRDQEADTRAGAQRGDVTSRLGHGQGAAPNGPARPSLPGLRMPCGSSADLTDCSTPWPAPSASAANRARLIPTPWWCERFPPPASTDRCPASHSATYVSSISFAGGVAANVK